MSTIVLNHFLVTPGLAITGVCIGMPLGSLIHCNRTLIMQSLDAVHWEEGKRYDAMALCIISSAWVPILGITIFFMYSISMFVKNMGVNATAFVLFGLLPGIVVAVLSIRFTSLYPLENASHLNCLQSLILRYTSDPGYKHHTHPPDEVDEIHHQLLALIRHRHPQYCFTSDHILLPRAISTCPSNVSFASQLHNQSHFASCDSCSDITMNNQAIVLGPRACQQCGFTMIETVPCSEIHCPRSRPNVEERSFCLYSTILKIQQELQCLQSFSHNPDAMFAQKERNYPTDCLAECSSSLSASSPRLVFQPSIESGNFRVPSTSPLSRSASRLVSPFQDLNHFCEAMMPDSWFSQQAEAASPARGNSSRDSPSNGGWAAATSCSNSFSSGEYVPTLSRHRLIDIHPSLIYYKGAIVVDLNDSSLRRLKQTHRLTQQESPSVVEQDSVVPYISELVPRALSQANETQALFPNGVGRCFDGGESAEALTLPRMVDRRRNQLISKANDRSPDNASDCLLKATFLGDADAEHLYDEENRTVDRRCTSYASVRKLQKATPSVRSVCILDVIKDNNEKHQGSSKLSVFKPKALSYAEEELCLRRAGYHVWSTNLLRRFNPKDCLSVLSHFRSLE